MVNQGLTGIYFHTPEHGKNGSLDITQLIAYIRQCGIPNVIWNFSDIPLNGLAETDPCAGNPSGAQRSI